MEKISLNNTIGNIQRIKHLPTNPNYISPSFNSTVDKVFSIIEELYIYCHLKNYNDYSPEEVEEDESIAKTIMIILIIIFSFTMIKVALISIYFIFITVLGNIGRFCGRIYRNKCNINILREIKFACFYLGKIFKKLYTYNFYAYENKLLGICLITLYLVFLSFNIMFTFEFIVITEEDIHEKPEYVKVLQIIAFELSIFMELLCCTFYTTRAIKNQFLLVCCSFLGLNLVVIGAVYYKMNLPDPSDENPRRCANLIFLTNFTILFIISAVKVTRYDLNCNY
jgi:hypothetical protein